MAHLSPDRNLWTVAATLLVLIGGICCGIVLLRPKSTMMDRIVALQLAGTTASLTLLLAAEGTDRPSFIDLALVLTVVSYPGSLLLVRIAERWLP